MDDNKAILSGLVVVMVVLVVFATVCGGTCVVKSNNKVTNKENHNTCVVECSKLHQPAECNDACTY